MFFLGDDFENGIEPKWTFWKKQVKPKYWELLMLSQSKDQKIRHKAVESLSKLSSSESMLLLNFL